MVAGHFTTICTIFACLLHVLIGGCAYTRNPDRLYQQRSAGLYLEWHLEGVMRWQCVRVCVHLVFFSPLYPVLTWVEAAVK